MYKAAKKNNEIQYYIEALALHTGAPTVHWENNTSCISVVEVKIVTPRVKHVDIPVYFLLENFDNGLSPPKYDKYSVMPEDICTKPCSDQIIIWITNLMTEFKLYPTSDTEEYQLMMLHQFVVN